MTSIPAWRRSTAAQRREQRAAFKALKAECAANPSNEILKHREKARRRDRRRDALRKMAAALAGKGAPPFTANMIARLKPAELAELRAYSAGRYQRLDPEQRRRLSANLYLLIVTVPDDAYMAVANMLPEITP